MERPAQGVGGGLPAGVGPQEVHDLLSMQAMRGGQDEQLHQGCRLPQAPLALLDRSGANRNRELTEQLDAYRLTRPTRSACAARPRRLGCWSPLRHLHRASLGTMITIPAAHRKRRSRASWQSAASSTAPRVCRDPALCWGILGAPRSSCKLGEKRRADERTRTAYPCSLRVITQALQGCAGVCKSRIPRRLSLLRVAGCCTVLRSRWYQRVSTLSHYPRHTLVKD
jgi:hypothetical protein